jgi:hypothetical protein
MIDEILNEQIRAIIEVLNRMPPQYLLCLNDIGTKEVSVYVGQAAFLLKEAGLIELTTVNGITFIRLTKD